VTVRPCYVTTYDSVTVSVNGCYSLSLTLLIAGLCESQLASHHSFVSTHTPVSRKPTKSFLTTNRLVYS